MIIINIAILLFYLFLFIVTWKTEKSKKAGTYKKRGIESNTEIILCKLYSSQVTTDLNLLYPTEKAKGKATAFYLRKIRMILLIIFVGNFIAMCLEISSHNNKIIENGQLIERNTYGAGEKEVSLIATVGEKEENLSIIISEQKFSKDQYDLAVKKMIQKIPKIILGKNSNYQEITEDLLLVDRISGYPIEITWESSRCDIVWHTGELQKQYINDNQEVFEKQNAKIIPITLTATFEYEQFKTLYDFQIEINIEKMYSIKTLKEKLNELVERENTQTVVNDKIELPNKIQETPIYWTEVQEKQGFKIMIFFVFSSIVLYFQMDYVLHKKVEERKKQLILDYPKIVCKLEILLGSGLSLKNAWSKIVSDYEKQNTKSKEMPYVYKEMKQTIYQMENGISEITAYIDFGQRCNEAKYLKLSSLLAQNLKKGSWGLFELIRKEVEDTNEERKSNARRLGEEAGTKLLFPMMLMLAVVMMIIMIPAFLSFNI